MQVNLHEVLDDIRRWIGDREAKSYTREGCRVSLANLPRERVMLDVDLAFPKDRAVKAQCDFILFAIDTEQECLVTVPMELKRGQVDASEAIKQLQEGARIAARIVPRNIKTICIPLLVHGGRIPKTRRRKRSKRAGVIFRGQESLIYTTRCSYEGNIADALRKTKQARESLISE